MRTFLLIAPLAATISLLAACSDDDPAGGAGETGGTGAAAGSGGEASGDGPADGGAGGTAGTSGGGSGGAAATGGSAGTGGAPTYCASLATSCHNVAPKADGGLSICHRAGHADDEAVCADIFDECETTCGDALCLALQSLCHDVDPGSGDIHECHQLGHTGTGAECFARPDCYDICAKAPRPDGDAGADAGAYGTDTREAGTDGDGG